ncbi:anti-sigma factor [Pseudomonas sp. SDI]|uniref:anti-sigma factor n=1 Tax=Pseudomonas sp. SDI TaxID=2170734 RepID=UPI000DE609A6|nr:anti-sigma factor [Pseudomonas sp. SDI]PWB30193.1 anti-sigma factor [Pseudomonas sp. SDI]
MLSCKELVACASDYLDGQQGFAQYLRTRQHLLLCRHCRRFIRQLRLTQATLRALPQAPVDDAESIVQRMHAEYQRHKKP